MPAENAVKCVKCLHYIRQMSAHPGAGRGGAWGVVFDYFIFFLAMCSFCTKATSPGLERSPTEMLAQKDPASWGSCPKGTGRERLGAAAFPCGWERMGKKRGEKIFQTGQLHLVHTVISEQPLEEKSDLSSPFLKFPWIFFFSLQERKYRFYLILSSTL